MAVIDLETRTKGQWFTKFMTVKNMTEILKSLAPNDELFPNRVGNLTVIRDGEMIGYIDFNGEEFIET